MESYKFYVSGMHCQACVLMTESELKDCPCVTSATTSLLEETVVVAGEFGGKDATAIAAELTKVLTKHGYSLTVDRPVPPTKRWKEFAYAVPLALGLIIAFVSLQRFGLINLIPGGTVTYATPFFVGIVASLSSCLAVVGGLVLTLSATFAKSGSTVRPIATFHIARIVSFFFLGGLIGVLGSAFRLGTMATLVVQIALAAVMLILGVNLLDLVAGAKRFQPSMPKFVSARVVRASKLTNGFVPALVGALTFFLPCGFTQSMQLYALSTGSFLTGALTMFAFSIGTFPVLALVSFGSFRLEKSERKGIFLRAAGILVIAFALFNLTNALVAAGYIQPIFNI